MSATMDIKVEPLADAIARTSSKTPVGSMLRSRQWRTVPLQLLQRAQFSATVESLKFLDRVQTNVLSALKNERDRMGAGILMDREEFAAQLREVGLREGLRPKEGELVGTIQDPTAYQRAKLIFDVQTQQAQGFAYWKTHNDPDVIQAAPAQELIRIEARRKPRDWRQRWREAAGAASDGDAYRMLTDNDRMIARIDSGIWLQLGTLFPDSLGNPFPPFAFGSGMNLRAVMRDEAIELGLIQGTERIQGNDVEFNTALESSVTDLKPEEIGWLKSTFGDQVQVADGVARWKNQ